MRTCTYYIHSSNPHKADILIHCTIHNETPYGNDQYHKTSQNHSFKTFKADILIHCTTHNETPYGNDQYHKTSQNHSFKTFNYPPKKLVPQ